MNQNEKLQMINERVLIVGADIAKRRHCIQPMLHNRVLLGKPFFIKNTKEEFESLLPKLKQIKQANRCEEVIVGLEPTGHYWKPFAWFLRENGIKVFLVNPFHVKKSKELDDNTQTKSDPKDAKVIGRLITEGRFFESYFPLGNWNELRNLNGTRNQIRAKSNAVLNNLRAILDEYFPEYETVFKKLTGKASMVILMNGFMPQDIKKIGPLGILAEFRKTIKRGIGIKKAELLYKSACSSIGLPINQAIKLKLKLLLEQLDLLNKQLEVIEKEMTIVLEATGVSQYVLSIKGIGIVTAAGILGEIGDPSRFKDWKQLCKLAGFNLVENSSGERQGQRHISKRGRAALRKYLYQVAVIAVARNNELHQLYEYLKNRKQNPLKKKQALVVIAIKILRIMWILICKKEFYDPNKALGEYRNNQLKAA